MNHDGNSDSRSMSPADSGKEMVLPQLSTTVSTLAASSITEGSTMMTMVGIVLVILVMIAVLFALGIFIDCRHQKLIDEKIDSSGRKRSRYTGSISQFFRRSKPNNVESSNIAEDMEDNGRSIPPTETVSEIV